jgi:hypothetical protein
MEAVSPERPEEIIREAVAGIRVEALKGGKPGS